MSGLSPVLTAAIQSIAINICSCFVALYLTPDRPPHFPSLIIYGILATPPNFYWQQFLEATFPGYDLKKVEVDDGGKGVEIEKKLNVRNTCIKVLLDQTVSAVVNVAAYIGVTRLLKGVPLDIAWSAVKSQTWPIMLAGYKLWPAVNVIQHVLIPVDKRTVVGSLVGLGWGTYLALTAA